MQQTTRRKPWGLVQVYTGNGKGKTTAALGLAIRAIGTGKRIAWIAFDKGGETHYSERNVLRDKFPEIAFWATGLDRIDATTGKFRMGVTDADRQEGRRAIDLAREALTPDRFDLVVLDEINPSASLGIVDEQEVIRLIREKPADTELVLTGRNALPSVLDQADLVTEMTLVKHYYYQGVGAREGLDY